MCVSTVDASTVQFKCHRDGLCCRFVGVVYPWLTEDGLRCRHLHGKNECSIYDKRPWICDFKKVIQRVEDPVAFTKLQNEICRQVRTMKRPSAKKMRKILRQAKAAQLVWSESLQEKPS